MRRLLGNISRGSLTLFVAMYFLDTVAQLTAYRVLMPGSTTEPRAYSRRDIGEPVIGALISGITFGVQSTCAPPPTRVAMRSDDFMTSRLLVICSEPVKGSRVVGTNLVRRPSQLPLIPSLPETQGTYGSVCHPLSLFPPESQQQPELLLELIVDRAGKVRSAEPVGKANWIDPELIGAAS